MTRSLLIKEVALAARGTVDGSVSMEPKGLLRGKAAIITGGEGSIGLATARAFAAEGARVCLIGLLADELEAGAASLDGKASWAVADVTDSVQVKTAVAGAAEAFARRRADRGRRDVDLGLSRPW